MQVSFLDTDRHLSVRHALEQNITRKGIGQLRLPQDRRLGDVGGRFTAVPQFAEAAVEPIALAVRLAET